MGLRESRKLLRVGFGFCRSRAPIKHQSFSIRDRNAQRSSRQLHLKYMNFIPTNETELFDAFLRFCITCPASCSCCGPPENKATVVPKFDLNALRTICIFYINILIKNYISILLSFFYFKN